MIQLNVKLQLRDNGEVVIRHEVPNKEVELDAHEQTGIFGIPPGKQAQQVAERLIANLRIWIIDRYKAETAHQIAVAEIHTQKE